MKKPVLLSLLALSCFYMEACHDQHKAKNYNNKTLVDDAGITILTQATEANHTEMEAAKLAIKSSSNPRVVNYAKMMMADHTSMGNEMQKLAVSKEVTTPDAIQPEHKQLLAALSSKTGADFDKTYMQMMVTDHEKVILLFHDATENTNASLNGFAEKYIGKLQMHLDSAKAISASLK